MRTNFVVVLLILSNFLALVAEERSPSKIDYGLEIRPILARNCLPCHGPDEESREADLRLDTRESAVDSMAIDDENFQDSELLARIFSTDPEEVMPPPDSGKVLTAVQRDLISKWVREGATYSQHWAFVAPKKSDVPRVADDVWSQNIVDRFLLSRMRAAAIEPATRADRFTLVRRLYLDLVGVLPSIEQAEAFVGDVRANAYERLVEKLLASPKYGERWTRPWLDLARYSDTNGYEKDRPRSIWPYRDWVVEALNADVSYDQFSIEQIAGDMLPKATQSQRVATGFHRNTMLNEEGGIDPLEYRFYAMVDRVATTGTVWMGLTIGCAQCHSHKYDPISHEDYFSFMALMNNTNEPDLFLDSAYAEDRLNLAQEIEGLELATTKRLLADSEFASSGSDFAKWCDEQSKHAANWQIVKPTKLSSNLPKLSVMEDGSVFASGDFTKRDEYRLTLELDGDRPITAIKIEALPDDRLPAAGPGRTYYEGRKGQFFLSELQLLDGRNNSLVLESASTSNSKKPMETSKIVNDGNGSSGWSNNGNAGVRHTLVATLEQPAAVDQIQMKMLFERHFVASLGRFRVSVTYDHGKVRALKIAPSAESVLARSLPFQEWTQQEKSLVVREFVRHSPTMSAQRKPIDQLKNRLRKRTHTLVMSERPADNVRPTHRHHRGEYLNPKEIVSGRVPAIFSESANSPTDRLGLARWLVSENNPLFARVVVNRTWRQFMGDGLVRSDGDFGTQASPPTHPKLLDWLAVDFAERGMSLKRLHRQIVLSAAYQQKSDPRVDLAEVDPLNELFARGPRHRLPGETIRDIYLSAANILSSKIGGPSVKPPQPTSVIAVAWGNPRWDVAKGEDRFRRSLYTYSKRTAPFAAFTTFDGPSGENCVAKRDRSNTPLQALTLLNDEMFVEFARHLGRSIYSDDETVSALVEQLFRRLLVRPPSELEIKTLRDYYRVQLERLSKGQLSALEIVGKKEASDPLAALVMVARVVMNLDETITKR